MTNEVKNVPEIRFPEFSGEWEEKMLGDVLTILDGDRGNNYPSQSDFLEFGHTLFLNASNVTKNGFSFTQKQYITEKKSISLGNGKLVKDDVVLTTRGSIGNIAWYDEEIYREIPYARINSGMLILRSNNKDMASFVSQFLKSIKGKRQIDRISFGSAQPQLTKKDIKLYRITFPQIKEQRKIGTFFSKLDRQIELEEEKLELLQQQKKGYMQKIFSQEIRFKDENVNEYPEWENYKLKDLTSYSSNGVDKKINKNNDIAYMVNYMDVFKKRKLNNKNREVLMTVTATEVQKEKNNLKKGDILFTPSSETREDIAKSTVVFEDLANTVYSYHLIRLRPLNNNIFSLNYSNYLSEQNFINKQFRRLAQGAQRYTLTREFFENITLSLPVLEEQQKIGDFFIKIDNFIENQSDKVELLKERKKGFLQKMFV